MQVEKVVEKVAMEMERMEVEVSVAEAMEVERTEEEATVVEASVAGAMVVERTEEEMTVAMAVAVAMAEQRQIGSSAELTSDAEEPGLG